MKTLSPAKDGLVSPSTTPTTSDAAVSTSGLGLTLMAMVGGAAPLPPPPAVVPPPLLHVWVLWQPGLPLAEATPEIARSGSVVTMAMARRRRERRRKLISQNR